MRINVLKKFMTLAVVVIFLLSGLAVVGSTSGSNDDVNYTDLLKNALKQLKGNFSAFGSDHFDKDFMDWIDQWDGESLPESGDIKIETAFGTFEIRNGRIDGVTPVEISIKIDNVLIVIAKMDGKGNKHGEALPPKDPGDPIVVLLDRKDMTSLIEMKLVLYHELIHVNQMRTGVFSEETSGNWELEAHSATIPLLIQLLREHPDKAKEIKDLYDSVIHNVKRYLAQAKDKNRAFEDLVKVKKEIKKEIARETYELEVKIDQLKEEIGEVKQKIQEMTNTSTPEDLAESFEAVLAALEALEGKLDDLITKLNELNEKNIGLLSDLEDLVNKMKKYKENEAKIEELKKELQNPPATGGGREWRDAIWEEIRELENENRVLFREIARLRGDIKDKIKEELKDIKDIEKLIDGFRGIQDDIEKLQKKINELLPMLEGEEFQELREELEMQNEKLSELSTELMIIDFKMETLKDLESIIKKGFRRGHW